MPEIERISADGCARRIWVINHILCREMHRRKHEFFFLRVLLLECVLVLGCVLLLGCVLFLGCVLLITTLFSPTLCKDLHHMRRRICVCVSYEAEDMCVCAKTCIIGSTHFASSLTRMCSLTRPASSEARTLRVLLLECVLLLDLHHRKHALCDG